MQVVAYFRTSSASNVGSDKDSLDRQSQAVDAFARHSGFSIGRRFYDAAVSGADPVDARPNFMAMLAFCAENDIKIILVENASRFARDLMVQLTGHQILKQRGIELIPVDAPTYFTDPSPTAVLIQQILGAVAQFEKAALVSKLKHARDAKRQKTGRCEGRKPVPPHHAAEARRLRSRGLSFRAVSYTMATTGFMGQGGAPYSASSIRAMTQE